MDVASRRICPKVLFALRGSEGLTRKVDRITPLNDILDLFALVDLVNQIGSMVDQPHGSLSGNPSAAKAVHVSDAQAVEAEVG